jgi:PAS domain S-box-containing protein
VADTNIPWHARLEARVLIAVTAVATASLTAMLWATTQVIAHYSLTRSADDLAAARAAFERLIETRTQSASKTTRLIVELPTFRDLITNPSAAADAPTVNHTTQEYCQKLGADFCVVGNPAGQWIGRSGAAASAESLPAFAALMRDAAAGRASSAMLVIDRGLYLVVAEPAMFGNVEVIGTLTASFRFDNAVASELAAATNSQVSFVCGAICGSSLSDAAARELSSLLSRQRDALGTPDMDLPGLRTIHGTQYVGGTYSLAGAAGHEIALVLLKDWTPTAQLLRQIDAALFWVSLLTLAVAFAGTVVFSGRLTRPLRDLAVAADGIAGGQWTRRAPSKGPAETRQLANVFNRMADAIGHWHDEVEARTAELNVAYQRLRSITDSASDAIVTIDARGRIVFWNPRAAAVFGFSESDAIGQPATILVPPEDLHRFGEAFRRVASGVDGWPDGAFETTAVCRSGARIAVELSVSTWSNDAGVFHTGIIRDMTERRKAAEALREREEQLRQAQKMEAVGRLAGGVAHDFNNLLTAILGYADLLIDELPADGAVRPRILEIQKAARTAATLTRDLLAFSRKQVLQPVVLDLNGVIENTGSLLRRLVGEDIEVELRLDPAIRAIRADAGQINQVLLNLSVNARDAMPEGGRLTISTRNTVVGGGAANEVWLTVQDTGSGMTDEVRTHIFEPFFTTKGLGQGTGLGLATVYGIVQQNGGRIWVDSAVGVGTTFSIAFPAAAQAPSFPEPAAERPIESRAATESVLLVEDNEVVRRMARDALAAEGYRVVEAPNGAEALHLALAELSTIDLVITDIVMPVMGGRELITRLRAERPDLKVIFTSGYASDPNTAQHARDFGGRFIQKPFVPSALRRAVRELLDAQTV